jgi:DNA repair protein RecO (recombination protein O)
MGDLVMVRGMVLSSMPVGEYDRRVVLLTHERGKISAFAKGARRMNSQLMGVTRPFCFGQFEVYEGRSSYDVKRADISNYFTEVSQDYDSVVYASYFMELADYYGRENLDAAPMLNLLYVTLKALGRGVVPKPLVRYAYELRLIQVNGECPDLFRCCHCGAQKGLHGFSMNEFGMLCDSCLSGDGSVIHISEDCAYTLQYMASTGLERLYAFNVSEGVLEELGLVLNRIRGRIIDKRMKSLEILESTL